MQLPDSLELDAETKQIAADAASILGYGRMATAVNEQNLLAAFKKLDIIPFDEADVERYKTAKKNEAWEKLTQTVRDYYGYSCSWRVSRLHEYLDAVPEFVLRKAVALKREFPTLEIFVDELRVFKQEPDPFLAVELPGGKRFWIEVWDEPGFEKL